MLFSVENNRIDLNHYRKLFSSYPGKLLKGCRFLDFAKWLLLLAVPL